jgi:HEAT repeat protein
MGLFGKKRLDRSRLEQGTVDQVLSYFRGKEVVLEDLDLLRDALAEPAIRAKLTGPEAIQTFANLLTTGDEVARQRSAEILGLLASPEAIPALVGAMQTDDNPWIRADAARALGRIGTEAVIEPLIEGCVKGDIVVSIGAAEALSAIGDPRGVEAIATRLASLADEGALAGKAQVGRTMFYIWPQYKDALARLTSPAAAEPLIPLLGKLHASYAHREQATSLLYAILNAGEETAAKMAGVVPEDVLAEALENHRASLRLRQSLR